MHRLRQTWNNLQTSFWFVPSLIVAGNIALAMGLIAAHSGGSAEWMARWPRLFGVSADGARGVLSAIGGSMITVLGVTFSMTLVTLALASSQYTSRILRNFMGDRVTQVVLGVFAGVFTYCLIVLRTIRGVDEGIFVPSLAVFVGVIQAIGGIGILIFFIHHIASSIQASTIIASVADETMASVERLFPEKLGEGQPDKDEDQTMIPAPERIWQAVPSSRNGYIQSVDNATLLSLAREHKTIIRMERRIGDFVVKDTTLASLALDGPAKKEIVTALEGAYGIDRYRTVKQDSAYGIRQIVDMALRALSPGVIDNASAVMCVDYLTAILAKVSSRDIPSSHRYEEKELRVIALGQTFSSLVAESFDQIRGSATGNVAIMIRMLGSLQTIASTTEGPSQRRVLREHVECIAELAERTITSPHDRERFQIKIARVRESFESGSNHAKEPAHG